MFIHNLITTYLIRLVLRWFMFVRKPMVSLTARKFYRFLLGSLLSFHALCFFTNNTNPIIYRSKTCTQQTLTIVQLVLSLFHWGTLYIQLHQLFSLTLPFCVYLTELATFIMSIGWQHKLHSFSSHLLRKQLQLFCKNNKLKP